MALRGSGAAVRARWARKFSGGWRLAGVAHAGAAQCPDSPEYDVRYDRRLVDLSLTRLKPPAETGSTSQAHSLPARRSDSVTSESAATSIGPRQRRPRVGEFTRSAAHAMMLPPPEMDDLALIPGLQMDELAHIERRQRAGRDGAGW